MTQPKDTQNEAKQRVLAVWPDAELVGYHDGAHAIFSRLAAKDRDTGYLGWGQEKYNVSSYKAEAEAWQDAASKLTPTAIGPDTDCDPGLPSVPFRDNFTEAAAFAGITFSQGCQFWMMMQHLLGKGPKPGFMPAEPTAIPAQEAKSGNQELPPLPADVGQDVYEILEVRESQLIAALGNYQTLLDDAVDMRTKLRDMAQEAKSGWIDVNQELPPVGKLVMMWFEAGYDAGPVIGNFLIQNEIDYGKFWDAGAGIYRQLILVTHWQPLPPPPEVK